MSDKEGIYCDGFRSIAGYVRSTIRDPKDFEFGRYGKILQAVRAGKSNEWIMKRWPGVDSVLCEMYRKIADGTTADMAKGDVEIRGLGKSYQRKLAMRAMAEQGMTIDEISKKTGWSIRTVTEACGGIARKEK